MAPDDGKRTPDEGGPTRDGGSCPICRRPTERRYRPFCSKRCADVDLYHWLSGRYVIPASTPPEEEDSAAAQPEAGADPDDETR